jgi:DNA-binding NarL/FixJ family response regulator
MLSMYDSRENVQRSLKAGAMGDGLKESAGREVVKAIQNVHTVRPFSAISDRDQLFASWFRFSFKLSPHHLSKPPDLHLSCSTLKGPTPDPEAEG